MNRYHCSCGSEHDNAEGLRDHLLTVFSPDNDRGNDGRTHAEMASDEERREHGYVCSCGLTVDGVEEFDDHMLLVFATPDHVGIDGKKHITIEPSEGSACYAA